MGSSVLETQLQKLSITDCPQASGCTALQILGDAFTDLLPTSTSDREMKMWEAFAEVLNKEVEFQEQREKGELSLDKKRQILADVLVWAEVTESDYDPNRAQFVTGPHQTDESFQRVGKFFQEAKASRGLQ